VTRRNVASPFSMSVTVVPNVAVVWSMEHSYYAEVLFWGPTISIEGFVVFLSP
jgi:hypothetical protein